MCFSAEVSFAASAVLLPTGVYCLVRAYRTDRRFLPLATFPALFGIQQAIEGLLWLGLDQVLPLESRWPALGFLWFAYFLWPCLVPLAAMPLQKSRTRRRAFAGLALLGLLFGASLFLPLLAEPDHLRVVMASGAILYDTVLVYDAWLPRGAVRLLYAILVALPLLFAALPRVRILGWLILVSVAISSVFFAYAFVSIWCFFAALLSLYVVYIVRDPGLSSGSRPRFST